jgi:hypothetical protein
MIRPPNTNEIDDNRSDTGIVRGNFLSLRNKTKRKREINKVCVVYGRHARESLWFPLDVVAFPPVGAGLVKQIPSNCRAAGEGVGLLAAGRPARCRILSLTFTHSPSSITIISSSFVSR